MLPHDFYNMIEEREDFIALLKEKAYRRGEFTLSSGKKSEHYVNCKPVTLQSDALLFISWCILDCLEEDTVAVGGPVSYTHLTLPTICSV